MRNKKATLVFSAALIAGALALGNTAWACTGAQAQVSILPRAAVLGEPVKVVSDGFSSEVPIQIRWNSATGPVVGSGAGPDNAVAVDIPADAAPGLYYLVVMQPLDGSKLGAGSFEVLAPHPGGQQSSRPTQRVSADLWAGFSSNRGAEAMEAAVPAPSRPVEALIGLGLVAVAAAGLMFVLVFAGLSARQRSLGAGAESNKPTG